jgi:3-oxoacyl-[acyl-carrier-protein] synthase-3
MGTAGRGFLLSGAGKGLPAHRLGNDKLASLLGVEEDGIFQRTGIRERRVAVEGESASSLGAAAALEALDRAGVSPEDVDLVLLSTYTPDHPLCPTAPTIASMIGATRAGSFDINGACSGGVAALLAATSMLEGTPFRTILVVTSDLSSFYVREDDPKTRLVFGDGASALVLRRPSDEADKPWQVLASTLGSDGTGADLFRVPDGGSARPPINGFKLNPVSTIEMNGRAVFRFAVDKGSQVIFDLCREANLRPDEVDVVIPHQANMRIIKSMSERCEIPEDRWFTNLERYGNTASTSVPLALTEMLETGRIETDASVLLVAFGAGLTWGGVALRAGSIFAR